MEISSMDKDQFLILNLKGRLDFGSSNNLKDQILSHINEGKNMIIINMTHVDFINSSGLGTLVSVMKEVRLAKGRLLLSNLATYVKEIFEITQLSHIFEIFETEEDAERSINKSFSKVSQ